MKKKVYMIGNAHLDPIWVWRWQEGSAETKATIRSALDRMKEYDDFRFVCSSAFVFECIEEYDTSMFEEIKQRVSEGKFIIVGGWYIQPDCNLPSGEGFARQSLYSQRYFKEKFGVMAEVGYNVDSFGHNAMMPQILRKSGMKGYVFTRPCDAEKEMESNLFNWIAPDGSSVPAFRILDRYEYNYADMDDFKARFKDVCETKLDCTDYIMNFYGVGNHGGGPTKHNIDLIHQFQKENNEYEVVFGNPAEYFDTVVENCNIPDYRGDLQHHASGCYSAVSAIKNAVRRSENNLLASENFSMMAYALLNKKYPNDKLKDAWKNVLFLHFHDSLGGCCIAPAYDDLYEFAGESLAISQKISNSALQTISWAIDTSDTSKGLPVIVFNPHPWEYNGLVTINKQAGSVFDNHGNAVRFQQIFSPAHNVYRRDDTMFEASVPALGYRVYYIKTEEPEKIENFVSVGDNYIENEILRAEFDSKTGYMVSLFDKLRNKEMLKGEGAVPIVIDEDEHDTWSHAKDYFDKKIGEFKGTEIKIIENGPIRAKIKITSKYGDSTLKQYFSLTSGRDSLDVDAEVDWNEKHKMLKLAFPLDIENPKSYYEIPFGYIERPCNGEEESGQMWVAMYGDNGGMAMLNNNKYSFSFCDNVMNLTVLRSPLFCDHGGPRTDESEFTDIGRHRFKYSLISVADKNFEKLIKRSRELNSSVVNIIENNHIGTLNDTYCGVNVEGSGVVVSAVKRAEDNSGTIIRAFETEGKNSEVIISGKILSKPLKALFEAHSVKTFYLSDNDDEWKEVLLTEFDM